MKADIRTDLAMEARELHAAGTGVSEQNEQREGYAISRIRIETDEAAKALGKAKGLYVTIDAPELTYGGAELTAAVTEAAANELSAMIAGLDGTALVAGLGNRAVTPDALGPRTAEKILVTRHIKQYMADAIPHHVRSVCAVSPGVLGVTGIETMEMIKGAASSSKPAVIIAIDSLASRRTERIGCTIQLCDVAHMGHAGETQLCDRDGKGFDLRRPHRCDATADRGQRESTNTIEQAAHRQSAHFATACTTVRVVLTAACAV